MLAPRKTLWSSPSSAIDAASRLVCLDSRDTLYDVGCGDGRVLIQLASTSKCRSFVGIEIDEDRANEAKINVALAVRKGEVPAGCKIEIRCVNALEVTDYSNATVIFLYLIPRGLRLIKPLLLDASVKAGRTIRVATYMNPLVGQICVVKETCQVDHQSGAMWPVYLFHLSGVEITEANQRISLTRSSKTTERTETKSRISMI